jgi:hypothetical protein
LEFKKSPPVTVKNQNVSKCTVNAMLKVSYVSIQEINVGILASASVVKIPKIQLKTKTLTVETMRKWRDLRIRTRNQLNPRKEPVIVKNPSVLKSIANVLMQTSLVDKLASARNARIMAITITPERTRIKGLLL